MREFNRTLKLNIRRSVHEDHAQQAKRRAPSSSIDSNHAWSTFRETPDFTNWLAALNDQRARLHIVRRIERIAAGNFGDSKSVGGAVNELRIDHGPGYRVYDTRRGKTVVILLCGGDKRTQSKDIRKAREIAETLED